MARKFAVLWALLLLALPVQARKHKAKDYQAFPPTHELMLEQNAYIDANHLPRIQNESQLHEFVQSGELVQIRTTRSLKLHIPANRAYVRPWVNDFLIELSDDFYAKFGKPIQVNSAVRTVQVQKRLRLWNRNAAPVSGEVASAHLAGVAVDLQRRGLTSVQRAYLQFRLLYWVSLGRVIVEEELRYPCFHIVVRDSYPGLPVTEPWETDQPLQLNPEE